MSQLRGAIVAAWWSLPLGLAEGHRAGRLAALHNTLFQEDPLRAPAVGATVVLFYAALFFGLALLAGAIGGLVERAGWGPASRIRDTVLFGALLFGWALLLDPSHAGPVGAFIQLASLGALGLAGFLIWRRAAARAPDRAALRGPGASLLAGTILLSSFALIASGALSEWPGSAAWTILAALVGGIAYASWRRPVVAAAVFFGLMAAVAAAGATLPSAAPAADRDGRPRAVILVTVDTLRRDALSCYGDRGTDTPNLDRLAAEGVLFERAYAPSSWTIPSIYSLLTSKLPHEIGMTGDIGIGRLADDVPRLPELLPPGYESRAVVTNVFGARDLGSWKGFDQVESADIATAGDALTRALVLPRLLLGLRPLHYEFTAARAGSVVDRAIANVEAMSGGPFLLWVHLYDPHSPYDPPAPFDAAAEELPTRLTDIRSRTLLHLRSGGRLDASDRAHLRALYDGEVAYTDAQLGRLWDALRELGLWEDALVIFTSDHGEEFWEHGSVEHGHTLYDELLRVPLLVKLPGNRAAGARVDEVVSLLDVLPTILDATGAPSPGSVALRGRSLLPMIDGAPAEPRSLYFEGVIHFRELKGSLERPWKLILDPVTGATELFQIDEDPGETWNRAPLEEERTEAMRAAIRPFLAAEEAVARDPMSPELRRRLRALGYLR